MRLPGGLCQRQRSVRGVCGGDMGGGRGVGLYELSTREILGRGGREQCKYMRALQRGELLGGYRRELVRRVRGVPGGGVLGDGGRE